MKKRIHEKNFRSRISTPLTVLALTASLLSGCGEPTIDGSTEESFKASVNQIKNTLPEQKQDEFQEAVMLLSFSQVDFSNILQEGASGIESAAQKSRRKLDGKTADQVLSEAEDVLIKRKARERTQSLNEIKELEKKKIEAEQAKENLKDFSVVRSRFYKHKSEYSYIDKPVIELTVKNGTGNAVSRAYFKGTLASPGRSVPWLQESFNYSIPGGLEPGEEATWKLAPNMFSDWGSVEAPDDAVLTVTVEQLDGPGGEELFSTRGFSSEDAARLENLKEEYE